MQKSLTQKPPNAGNGSPKARPNRYWEALRRHYTAPLTVVFKQFRAGLIYFAVGLMAVLMANTHMTPSLLQELVILAGLSLGLVGFVMAILAEVRLLIGRIVQFITKKP